MNTTAAGNDEPTRSRGKFIVLEGIDGVGKTTQSTRLIEYFTSIAQTANALPMHLAFPKRDTPVGQLIDKFLSKGCDIPEAGRVLHLLFSANRWEQKGVIEQALAQGRIVVCDRYVLSGLAYSAALGVPVTWTSACDCGLPVPDYVIYLETKDVKKTLDRLQEGVVAMERYEVLDFQQRVAEEYRKLLTNEGGHQAIIVDANLSEDEVFNEIVSNFKFVL